MRKELPKVYDPREVEPHIYQMWMDNGCFKACLLYTSDAADD